jgi:hypothetical protein
MYKFALVPLKSNSVNTPQHATLPPGPLDLVTYSVGAIKNKNPIGDARLK